MSANVTHKKQLSIGHLQGFIDGSWHSASEQFPVYNPATNEILAHVHNMGEHHTSLAVKSAYVAGIDWGMQSVQTRSDCLEHCARLLESNLEALALLTTSEQGKPLNESRDEWRNGVKQLRWCAQQALQLTGTSLPIDPDQTLKMTSREPLGVVFAITPWNFPVLSVLVKVGAALAAGCSVILKPSEFTPLSALAIAEHFAQTQLPHGVLNILPTVAPEIMAKQLLTDDRIKALSFTGSAAVGKKLNVLAAKSVKHVELELGGNAPFIIFEDANIAQAARDLIGAKFYNCGQICVGANRIYVHENIEQEFLEQFGMLTSELILGNGIDPATHCGPLIHELARCNAHARVKTALEQGASLYWQGKICSKRGSFFAPCILRGVTEKMHIRQEEIFAPIAAIGTFTCESKVLQLANSTTAGLAAYFYTQNDRNKLITTRAIKAGMVGCNTTHIFDSRLGFGGCDQSGQAREGGLNALLPYTQEKNIFLRF